MQGIAYAYLQDQHRDSVNTGLAWLQNLTQSSNPETRRKGRKQLIRELKNKKETGLVRAEVETLLQEGAEAEFGIKKSDGKGLYFCLPYRYCKIKRG